MDRLIAGLKKSVSQRLASLYVSRLPAALISRAVDEAEKLARTTGFPHLFLPVLAEEKVRLVSSFRSAA